MTLRELLSCWDNHVVLRLVAYGDCMMPKYLKVCFGHPEDCEDDLEELDMIADYQIKRWYFRDSLIVVLDADF